MFMIIGLGINVIVIIMMVDIYSKLDKLSAAVRRLTPKPVVLPETPSAEEPSD
jgi:hypothetical protein